MMPGPGPSTPGPGCWSIAAGGSTLVCGVAVGRSCASPVKGELAGRWQPVSVAAKDIPTRPCTRRVIMSTNLQCGFPAWAGRPRSRTLPACCQGGQSPALFFTEVCIDLSTPVPLAKSEESTGSSQAAGFPDCPCCRGHQRVRTCPSLAGETLPQPGFPGLAGLAGSHWQAGPWRPRSGLHRRRASITALRQPVRPTGPMPLSWPPRPSGSLPVRLPP